MPTTASTAPAQKVRKHAELDEIRSLIQEEPTPITPEILKKLRAYYGLKNESLTALRSIRGVGAAMPELSWDNGTKGRSHSFIASMQNAGYRCTHPAEPGQRGNRTSLASVLVWLHEHPTFRSQDWTTANVKARMKTLKPLKREVFQ